MASTGALNAPPKRTAFGDVSNTARTRVGDPIGKAANKEPNKTRAKPVTKAVNTRGTRLGDKENTKGGFKESRAKATIVSEGTNLSSKSQPGAPAQAANPVPRAGMPVPQHAGTSLAQPPLRNGASKKVVNIFQDPREEIRDIRPEVASFIDDIAVLVEIPVKNPRQYKSQPSLRIEHQGHRQQAKFFAQPGNVTDVEEEDDTDDNVTEAAYEDAVEQLPQGAGHARRGTLADMEQANYRTLYRDEEDAVVQSKALPELPVAAELEEYWDDEEEQEELSEGELERRQEMARIHAREVRMRQITEQSDANLRRSEDIFDFDEEPSEEERSQMLDEEDLVRGGPNQQMGSQGQVSGGAGHDMDMDADLDGDIPEAEGGYEHTDSEASLDSEEDGHDISYARSARVRRDRASLRRSGAPRSSLDISGLLSRDGSSMMGSSPQMRRGNY